MSDILFYAANQDFKEDLQNQISHHTQGFNFIEKNKSVSPDIIIVDEDQEVAQKWQDEYTQAPLFFITANHDNLSAEIAPQHLILKPFKLARFLDELNASLNLFENSEDGYLNFNQYVVRPIKKDILNLRNNEVIKLTEKEVAILKYLYKSPERIVTKNELLQEVWGYAPEVTTHTIETHIYRLRQKVEHENPEAQLIITLDGGYRLKF